MGGVNSLMAPTLTHPRARTSSSVVSAPPSRTTPPRTPLPTSASNIRQNVRVGGETDGGREKKGENERIKRDEYKNKGIPYPKNLIKHEQGFLYMVLRRLGEERE